MGKQVGSMDEEPQVRGCYNITFICTPTNHGSSTSNPARKPAFVGEWGWGVEGKQVGSMSEEPEVRGCYNITFNTLDNWAINPPPNQKGKGLERKGYRVMARNMYTIHSVTYIYIMDHSR